MGVQAPANRRGPYWRKALTASQVFCSLARAAEAVEPMFASLDRPPHFGQHRHRAASRQMD
jgi:hypothetical protein